MKDRDEFDLVAIYHDLPSFGKIHCQSAVYVGLDLSSPPVGLIGMANQDSGRQMRRQMRHRNVVPAVKRESVMNETELNSLVGSRICHDLISPLGAIGNGVELLSMAGMGSAPEITLITESVESANARIRFFRISFGAAPIEAMIGNNELRSVIADVFRGNRLQVDWRLQEDVYRVEAKLAFLLLQCLESALPWGGKILITRTDQKWNLFGKAERLKIEVPLWDTISNPNSHADISASSVHFALINPTASQTGRRVTTSITDSSISVSF